MCYFGFLQAGEITVPSKAAYDKGAHLNFTDVAVDNLSNPRVIKVTMKALKTDPFCQGVDIFIGRTFNKLCPVGAASPISQGKGTIRGRCFDLKTDDFSLETDL